MVMHGICEDIGGLLSQSSPVPRSGYILHGTFSPDFSEGIYHLAACRRIDSLSRDERRILLEGDLTVFRVTLTIPGTDSESARVHTSVPEDTRAWAMEDPRGFAFALLFSPLPDAEADVLAFLARSLACDLELPAEAARAAVFPLQERLGKAERG